MHRKILTSAALVLFTALLVPAAFSSSLLLNGSFEQPALGTGGFISGGGDAWTSAYTPGSFVGPGVWEDGYLGFTRIPAQDGQQVLWMPPGTSVAQSVTLTAGTSYMLGFYTSPQAWNPIDTELFVSITGVSQHVTGNYSVIAGSSSWTAHQLLFTADDSSNYTFSFFAQDTQTLYGINATQYLDNVTLTEVSGSSPTVPDAGTGVSLLALVLVGMLSIAKRVSCGTGEVSS